MVHTTKRMDRLNQQMFWDMEAGLTKASPDETWYRHDNPRFRFRILRSQEDGDKVGYSVVCRLQKKHSKLSTSHLNN